VRALLILALAAVVLGACQGGPQRADCPHGQVCLELGNNSEPATLDPQKANLVDEMAIIGDLMMGLLTDSPDGKPAPGIAERWETSADGLTWTFHLRDARWSDGVPVTAEDFVYGWRRILDPKTASIYAYLLYVIKNGEAVNSGKAPLTALGVSAPDPHTLVVELEHPAPYLLELAKHVSFSPAPKHAVERWGDAWVQPGHYVSDGPFKLVSWKLGDRITVVKNPYFWDAAHVCPDRINYYPTADAVSAERRVARGELDLNSKFQSNRIDRLAKTMPGVARTDVSLATIYLALNTRDVPAFKDIRVRRALSEAIDRDFIASKIVRAGQVPAYAFVPPITANYVEDGPRLRWADKPFGARQVEARALLAQAGYGPGHPLKFTFLTQTNSGSVLLAEAIQADWQAVGVDVTIAQNDASVAFAAYRNRNFQVGGMSWYGDYNDPMTFLGLLKSDTGAQNYGDYRNPAYDALLAAADHEPDAGKRAQILARAEQLMLDDEGIIPVYFQTNTNLVSPRLTGWAPNPPNFHRARYMCLKPAA
jgi:oligopeptide transport system substrate-binding protein